MDVTAKILERNDIHASQQALTKTREIDRELIEIAAQMPSKFWQPPAFAGLVIDSEEAFWETRRTWDCMCHYTLVNQLHLPYMLWPHHTSQSVYSRMACVHASREILTREIAMRIFNQVTPCCRMGDFMALIAGMTLMLAHIVSHSNKEEENLLVHQRSGDRAIIERALDCMKSMSEMRKDALAAKCATLLKHLLVAEAHAAQAQSYNPHDLQWKDGDHEDDPKALIIKVPYVGAIKVTREGITSIAPPESGQGQDCYRGVTIGGIGILRVDSPTSQDYNDYNGTSSVADLQTASTQIVDGPSTQGHATQVSQLTSEDVFAQQDQMFPDAAASIDEWVFQGFDTAFFEVLTREAGDYVGV
jgi:hypothetical protein